MAPSPFVPGFAGRFSAPAARACARRRPRTRALLLATLALSAWGQGCKRTRRGLTQVPSMAAAYDTSPLDAQALAKSPTALRRALGMPAGEVAARLGSFRAEDEVSFKLAQGENVLLQEQLQAQLSWDRRGNVQVAQKGSRHGFELVVIDEKAYVRLDRGHLRGKGRRDVEVMEMVEIAYSALRQATQQFGPLRVEGTEARPGTGRPSVTYAVHAGQAGDENLVDARAQALFVPGGLPTVVPGGWRQDPATLQVDGTLTVDVQTGVVLAARLSGRRSLAGPNGQPVVLSLQLRHAIAEVGGAFAVREPTNAVGEYRRPIRPREPLAFFRDQMPATPAPTAGNAAR